MKLGLRPKRRAAGPGCFCPARHEACRWRERVASWSCRGALISNSDALQGKTCMQVLRRTEDAVQLAHCCSAAAAAAAADRHNAPCPLSLRSTMGGNEPPHLSHSPQIFSGDDGLQSIKTLSLRSAGIHAAPPSNHPHIFHIAVCVCSQSTENGQARPSHR